MSGGGSGWAAPKIMSKLQERLTERVKEINGGNHQDTLGYDDQVAAGPVPAGDASDGNDGKFLQVSVVPQFAVSLQEAKERIQMLQRFVKEFMVPGEDYGVIPGSKKPSLLKPGAEKLTDIFGLTKFVEIVSRMEDWEKPFLHYEIKVTLLNKRSGHVEAEGIGSANSKEKKFARQDTYTIANTLLKMAKKRALVDAVLSATRSSGLFTQDIEDIVIDISPGNDSELNHKPSQPRQSKAVQNPGAKNNRASEGQLQQIYALARELSLSPQKAKQMLQVRYRVGDSRELSREQAVDFIEQLETLRGIGK